MRRRDLIGALAGGAAVLGLPAQSRKPLLGFGLYGMKQIPVRKAINQIARIGYKAMELTLMPTWNTEPKLLSLADRDEIRKQIGDLGLVLASVQESVQLASPNTMANLGFNMSYSKKENLERLREAAAIAHEVSPGPPAVIESPAGGRAAEWEARKTRDRGRTGRVGLDTRRAEDSTCHQRLRGYGRGPAREVAVVVGSGSEPDSLE